MSRPEISVVLTTFNRAALLSRAVDSVLAQTGAAFELIIIDDASTDDTSARLAALRDPRIRFKVAPTNLGPSGARNLGIEMASAPIVAFLDSDDIYLPGRLSVPLAAIAGDPDIVCTLSSARKFDRGLPRDARIPSLKLAAAAFEWALICDLIPVEATSITVRRDAAVAAGGFCPGLRLTEDREFLIRVARHGAGRLIDDILWEKAWSDDGLSMDWSHAAQGLAAYARERPEYTGRFAKLGSYLATKILVAHMRDHRYEKLWPDFQTLHRAGLVSANPWRAISSHLEVKKYRRAMSNAAALARLQGPPEAWR
ncbi:MAG: glycosyltransferase family 2 protein [Xanthobacteraceae bacterium]